ncbi:hypothetical protein INT43_003759 [Umbelopsis isabellina]|uniref:Rap-GAP domain-containing protein n=1 Tax=Mortierella isabellina TaxID=91625 RepID=A0A8H7PTE6_MORIS|nr:hypothetical protein INT43_003759 [Umbelopsis isabellina]
MPPHGYMKSSSLDDKDTPASLSVSSSISPRSSTSTLFTRAQLRLSSRFPKRVQSTLFPLRENTEHKQGRGFFGHRGSSSVTSLRDTARDDEDSCEEDKLKMFSATESINGYHVPWRHNQRNKFAADSDNNHNLNRESAQSLNMPLQLTQLADQHSLNDSPRPHSISAWRTPTDTLDDSSSPSPTRCTELIPGHLAVNLRPLSPFSVSDSSDGDQLDMMPFGVAGLHQRCEYLSTQESVSKKELFSILESIELLSMGYDDEVCQKEASDIKEKLHNDSYEASTMLHNYLGILSKLHYEPLMACPVEGYIIEDMFPARLPTDHLDLQTRWFRRHFVGKAYATFVGSNHIISVVREEAREFCGPGNAAAKLLGQQYRIIIRTNKLPDQRHVIHEVVANEMESRIETSRANGMSSTHSNLNGHSKKMAFNTRQNKTRTMRAAVASVFTEVDLANFKELTADETIHSGLERELLRFDEAGSPHHYKFGVMVVKPGQTCEEEWFANTECSPSFYRMMSAIADQVQLKGYLGWAGGLDTKTGESGANVYVSKWKEFDIVYHAAPLIPARESDRQQIHRKRHVGNDIVTLIFLEGDAKFDPTVIKSQFLHVFLLVREEMIDGRIAWRVEVMYNENVPPFGPILPSPALIYSAHDLRAFLSTKLINGENAALKSPKFAMPNSRAREGILANLIKTGLQPGSPRGITRSSSGAGSDTLSNRSRRGEVRSESSLAPPDLPPMPTPSRSSMLKELTSLARRRSGIQEKAKKEPPRRAISAPSREKDAKNKPSIQEYSHRGRIRQPSQALQRRYLCDLAQLLTALQQQIRLMRVMVSHNLYAGQSTLSATDHYLIKLTAFKSRAHNLFMMGRRETPKQEKLQENTKRFLRTSTFNKLTPSMTISTKSSSHPVEAQKSSKRTIP